MVISRYLRSEICGTYIHATYIKDEEIKSVDYLLIIQAAR